MIPFGSTSGLDATNPMPAPQTREQRLAHEARAGGRRKIRLVRASVPLAPDRDRPAGTAALETMSLDGELAAILRRRAGALMGVSLVVDVDPPGLEVRTASPELLRRVLSLQLSALAARPAVRRLEVTARCSDESGSGARLRVSARALLAPSPPTAGSRFRAVERRLLERAEASARLLRGVLIADDRHDDELRSCLEIEVAAVRREASTTGAKRSLRRVALVTADDGRARVWSRALATGAFVAERFETLSGLLRRADPWAGAAPRPDWVVVDGALVAGAPAALEALMKALGASGLGRHRVVVAAPAFVPLDERSGAGSGLPSLLAAPVLASELLRALGPAMDPVAEASPRCDGLAEKRILAAPVRFQSLA
jgi:hypothetical protein